MSIRDRLVDERHQATGVVHTLVTLGLWISNVLLVICNLLPNALLGGHPQETLSSRFSKAGHPDYSAYYSRWEQAIGRFMWNIAEDHMGQELSLREGRASNRDASI